MWNYGITVFLQHVSVPKELSLRLSSGKQSIFWMLVLWSILLGKSEFMYWMFFGGLSMFLDCIYSNFKCHHKLNPRNLQIQTILGCGSTEILWLCMGFTVPENLRTPPIFTTINWHFHYCWWSSDKMFFHSSLLSKILTCVSVSPLSIAFLWSSLIWYLHSFLGLPNGH